MHPGSVLWIFLCHQYQWLFTVWILDKLSDITTLIMTDFRAPAPAIIIIWIAYNSSISRFHMMTSSNGNISALLALCAENSPVIGEFPSQRPVTQSFDVFFDLCLNKRLSKQSLGWWFEMPSRSLWRHCNDRVNFNIQAETKYVGLCRQHFQINFLVLNSWYQISVTYVLKGPINNMTALVQIMV